MWQRAVMYHTRISSCCFLERQCFTDGLRERLLPRDSSECFRGSCLPGEVGDIGLQIRTKADNKNKTTPNEWGNGDCHNSEFCSRFSLYWYFPIFLFSAYCWPPLLDYGYSYIWVDTSCRVIDVTAQLQFPCNSKMHSCLVLTLHLNLVVGLQVIRETVNVGTQVMLQRKPSLLCAAKYVCLSTLSTYCWRHENINSKHHIPLTPPELLCFSVPHRPLPTTTYFLRRKKTI